MKSNKKWKPKANLEARRLALPENDWNLASHEGELPRTRHQRKREIEEESKNDSVARDETSPIATELMMEDGEDDLSSITEGASSSPKPGNRLNYSRAIIEIGPVSEMLTRHLSCQKCQHPLVVSFPTTGIASSCKLVCTDKVKCDYVALCAPASADIPLDEDAGSALITRSMDFALNVTCVLAFMASGDGGTEAERVLGMNGLPNSTTMQSAFSKIEQRISQPIQECTDEIVLENLREEVKLTFGDKTDNNNNKLHDLWLEKKLTQEMWPRIGGSTDMGWQQKGSGRLRNSQSGHALVIAPLTRKALVKAL